MLSADLFSCLHVSLRYARGIKLLEEAELKSQEEEDRQKELLKRLYLNKAFTCIKVGGKVFSSP